MFAANGGKGGLFPMTTWPFDRTMYCTVVCYSLGGESATTNVRLVDYCSTVQYRNRKVPKIDYNSILKQIIFRYYRT